MGGMLNATAYAVGQGATTAAATLDRGNVNQALNRAAANVNAGANGQNADANPADGQPAAGNTDAATAARNLDTPANRQKAADAAQTAARYVSSAAMWTFLAMLLSLAAAVTGGLVGALGPNVMLGRSDHDGVGTTVTR